MPLSAALSRARRTTSDAATRPDALERGHGETVLVVDDEPTVRMLIVEVLEELGYRVLEAADGAVGAEDPAVATRASTC